MEPTPILVSDRYLPGRHVRHLTHLSALLVSIRAQEAFEGKEWGLTSMALSSWKVHLLPEEGLPDRGRDLLAGVDDLIQREGNSALPLYVAIRHLADVRLLAGAWDRRAWRVDYYWSWRFVRSYFYDTESQARDGMAQPSQPGQHVELVCLAQESEEENELRRDWWAFLGSHWRQVAEAAVLAEAAQAAQWARENRDDPLYAGELDPWFEDEDE